MSQDVLDYLHHHNRPFSGNEIIQNVGKNKEITKAQIQKALDKLVNKGDIIEKVYNKQKIYCIKQEDAGDHQAVEEELKSIDRDISELQIKLKVTREKLITDTAKCKELEGRMTMVEAKEKQAKLEVEVTELRTRVEVLSTNTEVINEEDRKNVYEQHEKSLKEYRKRKRMCMEIVDSILEGYPKSKKQLCEDIGLELDEDVDFKLKSST